MAETSQAEAGGDTLIEALRALLGERLSTSAAVREQHGRDESYHATHAPDAVAFAQSTEEVAEIVRLCAAAKRPVIPFGTGTSLEGHVAALRGGICDRPVADERGPGGQRRRPRLPGSGRSDP